MLPAVAALLGGLLLEHTVRAGGRVRGSAQGAPCGLIFSCVACLGGQGCAWCSSNGGSCVVEFERELTCPVSAAQSLITQNPPGQVCPAALFSGQATAPRKELPRSQGGFATAAPPRKEFEAQFNIGKFEKDTDKLPLVAGALPPPPKYTQKELPNVLKS